MTGYYGSVFQPSRFLLWSTGMRPFKNHVKPTTYFFIAMAALVNVLTITSFLYDKTFTDVVDIIVTEVINFNIILRLVTLMYYEKELKDIFQNMQKLWPITDPKLHRILKYLRYFHGQMIAQTTVYSVAITTHAFFTGEQILHVHRPEMVPETLFVVLVVDGYYVFVCLLWVGFDMFFSTIGIVLAVQYTTLNGSLQGFITSKGQQKYSMQDCMEQSSLLKGIIANINTIFGPLLLIYIWLLIILLGTLMYIIYERNSNPMDSLKYFIILFALIIAIFVYYVTPAQLLTNEINKMFDEIYCTNWYECSLPVKKSLLMILTEKKTDAVITAYGKLVKINFAMCTSMFRTGFSVFTFLVHMKNFRSTDGE